MNMYFCGNCPNFGVTLLFYFFCPLSSPFSLDVLMDLIVLKGFLSARLFLMRYFSDKFVVFFFSQYIAPIGVTKSSSCFTGPQQWPLFNFNHAYYIEYLSQCSFFWLIRFTQNKISSYLIFCRLFLTTESVALTSILCERVVSIFLNFFIWLKVTWHTFAS